MEAARQGEALTADQRIERQMKFERRRRRLLERLVGALVVIQLAVGLAAIYLLVQNTQRTQDIQQSRRENVVRACLEVDARNANAVLFLKGLPPQPNQPKMTPKERNRLLHGFADALVGQPHKDCQAYADKVLK